MWLPESFTIPPKLYKKSESVVSLEELGVRGFGEDLHQNKELGELEARRGGTVIGKLLQLSKIYSIDDCYNIVMVLKLRINKE